MERDQEKIDSFTRRAFIIGALQGCALTVLGARLAWLQVVEGEKYKTLAENNRISIKILPPSRGQIVDRFGVPLATNLQNFQVLVTPEQVESLEKTLTDLKKYISVDDGSIKKALRQAKQKPAYVPVEVRNKLNWDEVSLVELNLPKLPGVSIQAGDLRSYPYKEATGHIIGYVGRVSEADMVSSAPLLAMPGFLVGKSALEKKYETVLQGLPGKAEVEVNVHGRAVQELNRTASIQGERLVLSIDAEFQRFAQQRLTTERSAAAIVMDAVTGAVYALANHPSFDPNIFSGGISAMDWEQLRDDPAHPLNNKVAGGLYPPGSTFKVCTALAGLEAGVIDEHTTAFCPGHYDFGNNRFHCWKAGGHGTVNVVGALAHSCDVYFYKMSNAVGIDRIAAMARRLGLGDSLNFDLPETKAGEVPDIAWKRKQRGDKTWHPGETINASIGQGYMLASPLQLATMTARIVNGGKSVKPWLAGYAGNKKIFQDEARDMGINPRHLELVCRGMEQVMQPGGTAAAAQIKEPGMQMGGKTGTSQVKRITKAERASGVRRQEDLPWHLRHHGLFIGYAPVDNPRYVCAVIVEHGGSGSGAAAPIARDLLLEVQKRNPAVKEMEKT
ncbi:MAG TPA: penicillin-binding protein 2 [Rhodospirillaceae bacterium]|nr:penicillin-binding protein 2 [Rhodospirillaceae bacterium]